MADALKTAMVWDVRALLPVVDGSVPELKHLLEIWLRQSTQLLSEMQSALENNDGAKLHLAAHTLKGSLQFLEADEHCPVVLELEIAGKTKHLEEAAQMLTKLENQIGVIRDPVIAFMNSN